MGSGASNAKHRPGDAAERSKLLGVALEYLLNDFVLEAREATCLHDPTFYVVSAELASGDGGKGKGLECPRDHQLDCSMVDALDRQGLADVATHFLSWCWAYRLQMYVESWQLWLRANRPDGVKIGDVYVWQCLFCNNQYRIEENSSAINDSLGTIFRSRLLRIRKMVVLLDRFMQPRYLTRVWCVYEMYTAVTSEEVSVDFMLPPQQATEIQEMIQAGGTNQIKEGFENVHSESATAFKREDEDMVKDEIRRSSGGFDAVDSKVREKMKEWVKQQFDRLLNTPSPSTKRKHEAGFLLREGLPCELIEKLTKEGIKTQEDLQEVKHELGDIGLTADEQAAVLRVLNKDKKMGHAPSRNLKTELQELGVPSACFAKLTDEQVLRDPNVANSLNFMQKKRFHKWRRERLQERLTGHVVTEELVALGLAVERGPHWCYDASDCDKTPEDGGLEGFGFVVGWRSAAGQPAGPQNEDALPTHGGWVRVHWQVTGFRKNYRMGLDGQHDLRFATPEKVEGSSDSSIASLEKGSLKLHQLRCDFGYPCGTKYSHYAKFDVRKDACLKVAGFVPGDVVEDKESTGPHSTCIGLKFNAEKKKVEMWFHVNGSTGAGIFQGADLDARFQKVGHVELREVRREELTGASDDEIEHDEREWVSRNLAPSCSCVSKGGHALEVDTRPELIQKFKMPYLSGDVLEDQQGGFMTCIGVARRPKQESHEYRKVDVWFHVQGSSGAGLNPNMYKDRGRFKVVRNDPNFSSDIYQEPAVDTSFDAKAAALKLAELKDGLQCDFPFPSGTVNADRELFDVRAEVLQSITGFVPGTVLKLRQRPSARLTLVGLRREPGGAEPKVWWHFRDGPEVHAGAGILEDWESLRPSMQDTGEKLDLAVFREQLKDIKGPSMEGLLSQLSFGDGGPLEEMLRQAMRREL